MNTEVTGNIFLDFYLGMQSHPFERSPSPNLLLSPSPPSKFPHLEKSSTFGSDENVCYRSRPKECIGKQLTGQTGTG